MKTWTLLEAVELATLIENIAKQCGAHIGLTGGLLYKSGPRKDLDFVVYRIRQEPSINREKFFNTMGAFGLRKKADYGFVVKAELGDRTIDFLFPDQDGGYPA